MASVHHGATHQYFNLTLLRSYTSTTWRVNRQKGGGCEQQPAHCNSPQTAHMSTRDIYLQPLVCGIEQQFDAILSQIQYEVMAEGHLEESTAGE